MRVELVTDARNHRSQAAIAKLGPCGRVCCADTRSPGQAMCDTVMYAVTDYDWPRVRATHEARLDAFLDL